MGMGGRVGDKQPAASNLRDFGFRHAEFPDPWGSHAGPGEQQDRAGNGQVILWPGQQQIPPGEAESGPGDYAPKVPMGGSPTP